MTAWRAYLLGILTAATIAVAIRDDITFTLVAWVPSIVVAIVAGILIHAAVGQGDGWRDLERRRPRSVP